MSKTFKAPTRLKSRIYSALLERQQLQGPLLSLGGVKAEGNQLCVFEELALIAPVGESVKRFNICRICHGRLLGENVENAPVYWPGCPYAQFQNH